MDLPRLFIALSIFGAAVTHAEQRLPDIPPAQYTAEQRQAANDFEQARKVPVFGPFAFMMQSPELMSRARAMGDYLRFRSAIGNTLSELVILITARAWTQEYEWSIHYPLALKAGIPKAVADSIAERRRPSQMTSDQEIVYDYTSELLQHQKVSDDIFNRAKARFGTKGVLDMTGIVGYYTFLSMQLNVAQYPPAKGAPTLHRTPGHGPAPPGRAAPATPPAP